MALASFHKIPIPKFEGPRRAPWSEIHLGKLYAWADKHNKSGARIKF